jgi:hypothetical protein
MFCPMQETSSWYIMKKCYKVLLVSQERISMELCTRTYSEWTGILKQMECEDHSSPAAIHHFYDDQYIPEEGLQNRNNLISRN